MRHVIASLVAVIAGFAPAIAAQSRLVDQATLVITRGSALVGREQFVLRSGRQSAPGSGFTLTVRAHYPASRPDPILVSIFEFGPDSQPATGRLDLDTGERPSVLISVTPRRITVRSVTPGAESARQYPAVARALLTDEFLVSLHAVLPSRREGTITTIDPRTGRTETVELLDLGAGSTLVGDAQITLRHLTLGSGNQLRHLWYDAEGRLMKVEVTDGSLVATRSPGG
jgi:hypothetical protein